MTRANFNTGRDDAAEVRQLLRAGHVAVGNRLTINPGPPLRAGEAGRHARHRLHAEEQLGAAHRRDLRRDRRRQDEDVRQLRPLLRADSERSRRPGAVGRRRHEPRRLLRRSADAADSQRRRTRSATGTSSPSTSSCRASAPTRSIRTRSCRTPTNIIVGVEREIMPNTSVGVRYTYQEHRPRARGRGERADGGVRPRRARARSSVEYILTNPSSSTPVLESAAFLGAHVRRCGSQVPGGRSHAEPAILEQLVDARVVPMVAAARQLRGVLSRRQRPVGSGHHVAVRFPDQRSELHRDRRARVRLPRRHPVPRRSATASCRSIGRTRCKFFGNYSFPMGLGLGVGLDLSSGAPLTPLAASPNYTNGGEIPEGAARLGHSDDRRLQDAHAVPERRRPPGLVRRSSSGAARGS